MALMTTNNVKDSGAIPTLSAVTAVTGDTAAIGTGHNSFVLYSNAGLSTMTVTVTDYAVNDNTDAAANHVVTVPAASASPGTPGQVLIPLRKSYDPGTGLATLVPSTATNVTATLLVMG